LNIEIITTKDENSAESGFGTIKTCNSLSDSINLMGHNVIIDICQTLEELKKVVERKPDLVILAVKHILSKDGKIIWLSEFFAENKINFSGSLKDTLMFGSDKVLAKSYLKDKGISTPRYFTAIPGEYTRDYDIPINYPLILKPIHTGNYNYKEEYTPVCNFAEFESQVLSLHALFKVPVLVEEYLDGQDFIVSIIKAKNGEMLVSAIELVTAKPDKRMLLLDEVAKKENIKELIHIEDKVIRNRVKNLAIDAYIDLQIRDFGQIDIKSNKSGHCYFMQANLLPSMTEEMSYFLKAFNMELGLSYDEVIGLIVDEGISRV